MVVFLCLFILTAAWALWESGLDAWGLQARLLAPAVLAYWIVFPALRTSLRIGLPALALIGLIAVSLPDRPALADSAPAPRVLADAQASEWRSYGHDLAGTRFSSASQLTPGNVGNLKQAWVHHAGVAKGMGFEATPLMVDDTLYLCTPNNIVLALDPDTGARRWQFDPRIDSPPAPACRGVTYFEASADNAPCARRILFGTADARLMAVDSRTGQACSGFGSAGSVDLKQGMGVVERGYYYITSAPMIVNGIVVLGGWILDNQHVGEPSGVIRGFDARTGAFVWAWDMDRPDWSGMPGPGKTFSRGTPNAWGPMSGDEALGLVFAPIGNSTPDYWGGLRSKASDRYSSSVIALDSRTGQPRWNFQTVHHDLWDYDVSAQPTLVDFPVGGNVVPALIQATKQGQVYVLDRRTGKPLTKVVERPVPQGAAAGDYLSPTQPFSTGMPAFDNTVISEQLMWGATPIDQLWCRIKFRQARYEGPYTPPGTRPTIFYPSFLGGINWGGVSIDPERQLMTVNWNRVANYARLIPRAEADAVPPPSAGAVHVGAPVPQTGTPFAVTSGAFLSPLGIPCTQPPFGKITVVDLKTRKVVWDKPLGTSADSGPMGIASRLLLPMGVPNAGGSLMTRSGLIFIAATQEKAIRAFDTRSGQLLWRASLPAGGHASPMTYTSPRTGRQYVVIAAGGNATLSSGAGDALVAFALP